MSLEPAVMIFTETAAPCLRNALRKQLNQSKTAGISLSKQQSLGLDVPSQSYSWQQRVGHLFDPALRDAEDMMLSLPYADIREKTASLATSMDAGSYRDQVLQEKSQMYITNLSNHFRKSALRLVDLIYICYNALITIIVNYTQSMAHETEMQARRCLTAALAEMDELMS